MTNDEGRTVDRLPFAIRYWSLVIPSSLVGHSSLPRSGLDHRARLGAVRGVAVGSHRLADLIPDGQEGVGAGGVELAALLALEFLEGQLRRAALLVGVVGPV